MKRFVRGMLVCFLSAAVFGCGGSGGDDDPAPGGDDPGSGAGSFTVQGYAAQGLTKGWTEANEGDLDLYLYSVTPDNATAVDFINLTLNTGSLAAGTYTTADGSLMAGTVGIDYTASTLAFSFLGDLDTASEAGASTVTVTGSGSDYTLAYTLYLNPIDDAETTITLTGTYSGPLSKLE